jgi:hypothetical protein
MEAVLIVATIAVEVGARFARRDAAGIDHAAAERRDPNAGGNYAAPNP